MIHDSRRAAAVLLEGLPVAVDVWVPWVAADGRETRRGLEAHWPALQQLYSTGCRFSFGLVAMAHPGNCHRHKHVKVAGKGSKKHYRLEFDGHTCLLRSVNVQTPRSQDHIENCSVPFLPQRNQLQCNLYMLSCNIPHPTVSNHGTLLFLPSTAVAGSKQTHQDLCKQKNTQTCTKFITVPNLPA